MGILDNTIKTTTPGAPKGIIYGLPGIGKTTFGASHPNSIVIDCENGANTLDPERAKGQRTHYLRSWPEIKMALEELRDDSHPFKIVAIDSLDWLLTRIKHHITGADKDITQTIHRTCGGYGTGKQIFENYVYINLLTTLDAIVERGIGIILLAHAKRTTIYDVDGISVEKIAPDLPAEHLNTFVEWANFVFLARKTQSGQRVLVTEETSQALAKNRYNMPPAIPFEWADFVAAISRPNTIRQEGITQNG